MVKYKNNNEQYKSTTHRLKAFSKICFSLAELATKITVSGDDTEFFFCCLPAKAPPLFVSDFEGAGKAAKEPPPPASPNAAVNDNDDDNEEYDDVADDEEDDEEEEEEDESFFVSISDAGTILFPVACCARHFSLHSREYCCMKFCCLC